MADVNNDEIRSISTIFCKLKLQYIKMCMYLGVYLLAAFWSALECTKVARSNIWQTWATENIKPSSGKN